MSKPEQNFPKPMLIVVMGVAATGKTTLAKALCERLDLPYIEGDDLHPPENIKKMSSGQPLTDADREPWLTLLRTSAEHLIAEQQNDHTPNPTPVPEHAQEPSETASSKPHRYRAGAIIACSALRKYYRDILRGKLRSNLPKPLHELEPPLPPEALPTYFVFIKGERDLLLARITRRQGHYMKANMVDSQLQTLESPEGEEGVIVVGMQQSIEEKVKVVLKQLSEMTGGL
ncbi:carbohydrate kinase [Laetiporus sulphureus 93-53]|uniref:gluconokinase n=1 Tax=Laetiporus sulphureus 93-53 TaxID=1314785 RepID=A0A165GUC8_9APHY|nr:carbohydrate kinase [Laetiporus sulphureus 93-53]KZT10823.1 carbohydrate kinase [Laetiporus sulphureus 93-53]